VFIKFPYQYKEISFGRIFNPLVRLEVQTPSGWVGFKFLLDSGADVSVLPFSLVSFLGVKVKESKKTEIGGVEGREVEGYPGKIKVRLGEEEISIRCYFVKSETIPLLGRLDIFDRFNILFDRQKQEICFEKEKLGFFGKLKRLIFGDREKKRF